MRPYRESEPRLSRPSLCPPGLFFSIALNSECQGLNSGGVGSKGFQQVERVDAFDADDFPINGYGGACSLRSA